MPHVNSGLDAHVWALACGTGFIWPDKVWSEAPVFSEGHPLLMCRSVEYADKHRLEDVFVF